MQIKATKHTINCLDFPSIRYILYIDKVIDIYRNREFLFGLGKRQQH